MSLLPSIFLEDWDVIQVYGDDATSFLNNLLTIDVSKLLLSKENASGDQHLRLSAFCSGKGRVIATFWISLHETDQLQKSYFIWISKDMAKDFTKELKKFVFRSKVKIEYQENKFRLLAYLSTNKKDISSVSENSNISILLPTVKTENKFFFRLINAVINNDLKDINLLVNNKQINEWNLLEIQSGIPRVIKNISQMFIPQMINLESVHGVDFQKGCYPGQEIIARSQYRGSIKRRLKLAEFPIIDECKPTPGDLIFSNQDLNQPAGVVIMAEINNQKKIFELQIEIKLV